MVFFLNLAAIRLSSKIEQLRLAEQRLMDHAKQFRDENDCCSCSIRTLDTKIPQSAIPLTHHMDDMYWFDTEDNFNDNEEKTYTIHGVHVLSQSSITNHRNGQSNNNRDTQQKYEKSKVPLVLLHGYMNGCLYFYRNLYGLSQYFENIYSLDWLGWGLSSRPRMAALPQPSREMTEAFFVESLEAWRKVQQVETMILAGHSMGGYIAVAYTEKYPHRVERLILISPAGVPEQPTTAQTPQSSSSHAATTATKSKQQSETTPSMLSTTQSPAMLQDWMFSKFNQIRKRMLKDLYTHAYHNYSVGDLLRALPSSYVRHRIESYVQHRFGTTTDASKVNSSNHHNRQNNRIQMTPDEQTALSDYLYWNNALPGSAEYCISRFLTPMVVFGQAPTVHRIPNLAVKSVAFLYGDKDWMDPLQGGYAVQQTCLDKQRQRQKEGEEHASTTIPPEITLHTIPNAGHLLMLENWQEFNRQLVLGAGLQPLLRQRPQPEERRMELPQQEHNPPEFGSSPSSSSSPMSSFRRSQPVDKKWHTLNQRRRHYHHGKSIAPTTPTPSTTVPVSSSSVLSSSSSGAPLKRNSHALLPYTIQHIHRIHRIQL